MKNIVQGFIGHTRLKRINLLAIWIVLILTVVFTVVLIQEEYHTFATMIKKERHLYEKAQDSSLRKLSSQIQNLVKERYLFNQETIEQSLRRLAYLFTQEKEQFTMIVTPDKRVLNAKEGFLVSDSVINQQTPKLYDLDHANKVLVMSTPLIDGYTLVVGLYTQPSEIGYHQRENFMKSRLIKIVLEFSTLAFILFSIIFGVNKIVNTLLARDIKVFLDFFSHAAHSDQMMNPDEIFFKEFKTIVLYANEMVKTIANQKYSLQNLNVSLEERVKAKTKALELKNSALESEKQYSQELLASQKLFIRHAIHETNTPLAVIMANIELFELTQGKNRNLSKIEAAMKNIFVIFDDLSYLVKKDQIEYPRHHIDLVDYMRTRIMFFAEIALQGHVKFAFESDFAHFDIYFNETKLQRIIDNNLSNAIRYTQAYKTILVTIKEHANSAEVKFCSHSKQIEAPEKIFEAFYREDDLKEGFGLGLNLVKRICDEEGVVIDLTTDDAITCFSYTFLGSEA